MGEAVGGGGGGSGEAEGGRGRANWGREGGSGVTPEETGRAAPRSAAEAVSLGAGHGASGGARRDEGSGGGENGEAADGRGRANPAREGGSKVVGRRGRREGQGEGGRQREEGCFSTKSQIHNITQGSQGSETSFRRHHLCHDCS